MMAPQFDVPARIVVFTSIAIIRSDKQDEQMTDFPGNVDRGTPVEAGSMMGREGEEFGRL
ncbi:hypothetical protein GCM10020370_48340 [Paenibacillus hodogayensis]